MCFILCSMWCHHDIQWCSHNVFVIVIIVRINLYICMHHHHERNLTHPTTYSRKFWLYKIVQKCLETLKKKFSWLLFSLNKHAMFRPHPYQLIATSHMQTCQREEIIKQISKHVQQWVFLLCGGHLAYESIWTSAIGENYLLEQKESSPLILTSIALECLSRFHWQLTCMVAG